MIRIPELLFTGVLLASPTLNAQAAAGPSAGVTYDQHLGQWLPADTPLRDETGARRSLGHWIGATPTVLVFGYSHCSSLCPTLLRSVGTALARSGLAPGSDWHGLFISIDPAERSRNLSRMKLAQVPAGQQAAWHFLTSDDGSAVRLAAEAGFTARYDVATSQFAHAAGMVVLSPDVRIVRYFFGAGFEPAVLRQALLEANAGKPQPPATPLLLTCFHLVTPVALRTASIMDWLRAFCLLSAAGLVYALRRGRRGAAPGATR